MSAWLHHYILQRKLLPLRLPHYGFRDLDPLLTRQSDDERERFPWSHRQITRGSPKPILFHPDNHGPAASAAG